MRSGEPGRSLCPPAPGSTVITSATSIAESAARNGSIGVPGFTLSPALSPRARIALAAAIGSATVSMCTIRWLAPAVAKASRNRRGSTIIKCTSRGSRVSRRIASTTIGPKVRLGTNCPSIMST